MKLSINNWVFLKVWEFVLLNISITFIVTRIDIWMIKDEKVVLVCEI